MAPFRAAPAEKKNGQGRAVNYCLFLQAAPYPHPRVFRKCNFKDLLCGQLKERDISSPQEADNLVGRARQERSNNSVRL